MTEDAIYPIDYETPQGQVRLLIADTTEDDPIFTDAQIAAFLTIESQHVKRAAARALDVIAVSEALVSKVIRTQDLSTNGAQTAKALREQAAALRAEANDEIDAGDEGFYFSVVSGKRRAPELTEWPFGCP